jgi:hypothetical protein
MMLSEQPAILQPIVALGLWTFFMWAWMYATRIPAIGRSDIDAGQWVGGVGADLDRALPPAVQWKAHNYNHLFEQPTLFYAMGLVLAMIGEGDGANATIAWAYVGLRIVHSLFQALVNKVTVRFALFVAASIPLMMLTAHAAMAVFGH